MTTTKLNGLMIALILFLLASVASGDPAPLTMTAEGTWISANDDRNGPWQAIFQGAEVDSTGRITIVAGDLSVGGMPELVQGAVVGSLQPNSIEFGSCMTTSSAPRLGA